MASGSETTSRTRMRPPHVRQRVMSSAKTRARSFAQLAPGKSGRGERNQKPFKTIQGVRIPSGKGQQPAGSESCMVYGNVHREA